MGILEDDVVKMRKRKFDRFYVFYDVDSVSIFFNLGI